MFVTCPTQIQKFQQNALVGRPVYAGIGEKSLVDLQGFVPGMDTLQLAIEVLDIFLICQKIFPVEHNNALRVGAVPPQAGKQNAVEALILRRFLLGDTPIEDGMDTGLVQINGMKPFLPDKRFLLRNPITQSSCCAGAVPKFCCFTYHTISACPL